MVEENVPCEVETEENLSFPETPTELLPEDEEIYKRLNIPWFPNEMQAIAGNKAFDSEKENLQRTINNISIQWNICRRQMMVWSWQIEDSERIWMR